MNKDAIQRRRLSRWSLLMVLVATAMMSLIPAWVAYQLNWIRQRHGGQIDVSLWRLPDRSSRAPWPLWMFGEGDVLSIEQRVEESASQESIDRERDRLARLYPEATIIVEKESEWIAREQARLQSQFPGATISIEPIP